MPSWTPRGGRERVHGWAGRRSHRELRGVALDAAVTASCAGPAGRRERARPGLDYNETSGLWEQDATHVATLSNNTYTVGLPHFSIANVDEAKQDADCMQVVVDTSKLSLPLKVHLTVPKGNQNVPFDRTLNDPIDAIVRLPPTTQIQIDVYDSTGVNFIPGATVHPTTGAATTGLANRDPTYPYQLNGMGDCHSTVTLTVSNPAPPADGFLTQFKNTAADAMRYYSVIDKFMARTNLTDWKSVNGFNSGDDAAAIYLNKGDLNLGRSMHMKQMGNNYAFYVSNYHTADEAFQGGTPSATVAMEYSPLDSGGLPFTKFYIFNGNGNRMNDVDLDGNGAKFLPSLCVVCHGGTNIDQDVEWSGDLQSQFIPFDLASFGYPGKSSRPDQEQNFYTLNLAVSHTIAPNTGNTGIQALFNSWYPNLQAPQVTGIRTGDWMSKFPTLYDNVVAPSCRSCHITRPSFIDWANWANDFGSQLSSIGTFACTLKSMPQSKVAWSNFWLSTNPSQPTLLQQVLASQAINVTCQ